MPAEPNFSALVVHSLVVPPVPPSRSVTDNGEEKDSRRASGTRKKPRTSLRGSLDEVAGMRTSSKNRTTTGSFLHETGCVQKVNKKAGLNLFEQAFRSPGRLRLREMDPRRIVYKDSASTRVIVDPRDKTFQGACRVVSCLQSKIRGIQWSMKVTGVTRASVVPAEDGTSSDDEYDESDEDDDAINSDEGISSRGSTAGRSAFSIGWSRAGSSYAPSSQSRTLGNLNAKQRKKNAHISGWLSQYSGCTKGHGDRLLNKIYSRRCQELKVKMNSGMKEILVAAPPCFCSLQSVNLSNFLIGDRGVQGLWPLLRYARALRCLNLAGNGIRDSGTRQIIKAFESEFYQEKNNADVGLLVLDLSQNPITGAVAEELYTFYQARKDVMLLGLAKTELPNVKRQRLVRACLAKVRESDNAVMLETWRLGKVAFFDLELFLQCERIVEGTHGTGIHDVFDQEIDVLSKLNRRVSWNNDEWNDYGNDNNPNDEANNDSDENNEIKEPELDFKRAISFDTFQELEAWGDFHVSDTPTPTMDFRRSPPRTSPPPGHENETAYPPGEFVDIEFDRLTMPGTPSPPPQNPFLSPKLQTKNPFAKNDMGFNQSSRRQKHAFVQRCRSR